MNFKTLSEAAFVYLYLKKKELETYFIKNKEN